MDGKAVLDGRLSGKVPFKAVPTRATPVTDIPLPMYLDDDALIEAGSSAYDESGAYLNCLDRYVIDDGREFTSRLLQQLLDSLGTDFHVRPPSTMLARSGAIEALFRQSAGDQDECD